MDHEYDYIATLSQDEKRIFVESFCCMVYADGNVAKEEIEFLKGIGKLYGITEQEIVTILKSMKSDVVMERIGTLSDRNKILHLLKELCYLANSDTGLDDSEIDFIIDVAEKTNIDSETLKKINKWVLDKIVLQKTWELLTEADNQ